MKSVKFITRNVIRKKMAKKIYQKTFYINNVLIKYNMGKIK